MLTSLSTSLFRRVGLLLNSDHFCIKKKIYLEQKNLPVVFIWGQALFVQYRKSRKLVQLVALNLYQTQLLRFSKPQQLNTRISEKC